MNLKLRTQFSLLVSALILVIMLVVAVVLFISEKQFIIKEERNSQIALVRNYIHICEESLPLNDDLMIINYSDMLSRTDESVAYAAYLGNDNKTLRSRNNKYIEHLLEKSGLRIIKNIDLFFQDYVGPSGERLLDVSRPVYLNGDIAGIAHVGMYQDVLDRKITAALKTMRNRIALVAVAALFIGILGSFLLAFTLTRPINKLVEGARLIGTGKLNTKIEINSKNEIGGLAGEFNLMAKKLEELDELKNNFVSSVSHELRSPLSYIKGYIEIFLEDSEETLTQKQAEYFTIIRKNVSRLTHFINDILDLAKIEAGQQSIKPVSGDIGRLVKEITDFAEPAFQEKKIELKTEFSDNLPAVFVDEDKTRHVVNNLVNNALKFTPEQGCITVGAKIAGPGFVAVFVKDTGIGIPANALSAVFDKFRQTNPEHEKVGKAKGTGLGLAIAKGYVELQGGKIWVESAGMHGSGSTFFFTVPVVK